MAEKRKFLDVWIVESNTVYREVPYTVVTDWVQQGRLLEDDRLKPAGSANWIRLGDTAAFATFLPKAEQFRVEDQAEALEPVQVDFTWKRRRSDEDDDVDMIPLIDISLVLLIFFMMTAAVGGAGTLIATPRAQHFDVTASPELVWIGITPGKNADQPEYMLAKGEGGQVESYASRDELMRALETMLQQESKPVDVSIRGHHAMPFREVILDMTIRLGPLQRTGKIRNIHTEVSQKEGS
jgi:biopolymer transport protein ExbD